MRRTLLSLSRTYSPAFIARSNRRVHRQSGLRPLLSQLEDRTLLSTLTSASDISGDWDNPAMWTGDVVPGAVFCRRGPRLRWVRADGRQ
jgi:hypothetical protein